MPETISTQNLREALLWRYATKQFDPTRKIPSETWAALEESLRLTPSSYGVQPWKFIIITNPGLREKLVTYSWKQRQVADASHLVVFAIKKNFGMKDLEEYIANIEEVRGVSRDQFKSYCDMMISDIINGERSKKINDWASLQLYIALGNFMTSAALLGIDTCPLEGIQPDQYDAELGLPEKGLASVVACVAGYRAPTDRYAEMKKVRFSPDKVFLRFE